MANRSKKTTKASVEAAETADTHPPENRTALPSLSRILSVVMLILGIIAVGALFYKVMAGFFVPLFLAALLVVIFRPVHEWIFLRTGGKKRVSALATTGLVLAVVLMPLILIISVATSQFTAMVSHVNFEALTQALDRGREQLGISLAHAEQFRRLDQLSDSLDETEDATIVVANVNEAYALVDFLQREVEGPETAAAFADIAMDQLREFGSPATEEPAVDEENPIGKLDAEERFHRQSLAASASIRNWMRAKLGGTFTSQLRLLANPSAEDFKNLLSRVRETLQPRFVSLTSATGTYLIQILVGLAVLVIAVYFFLIDGAAMIRTLMRLSPLDDNYEARLLMEFDRTSRAVVLASVLSALVQGVLSAIAFWFCGFESIILLFLITSMMALVPFLGAASVWLPCAVYLGTVDQRWTAAVVLAIYGTTIVSSIDNVIKMYVLQGRSTLHPLFALLSVLGGVKVFGPIGILVGPMVVVFLQTLLEILNHELAGRDATAALEGTPPMAEAD
ncbi:putative inner membrane protein [Rubripirellula tenax]|uniref:Putative inner membrane protein n=1 Tax=Rubripirellula tenax TaxID=2528015 RepID=A0A5C6F4M4_9BACT|nr:AI-2E family transporter [Rubripirellula tenax]TWU56693.1 putative inner membrane protein [Rubripirellula tenax]